MKVVCSYCEKLIGEKEPLDRADISHGMCPDCLEHFTKQWEGLKLEQYLDLFDTPVVAVDTEGRVIAQNSKMAQLVMKGNHEMIGRQPGDIMECQYARLPAGCGHTVHCEACAIRRAINHTAKTGAACKNMPASINQDSGKSDMSVSTEYRENYILVTISQRSPSGSRPLLAGQSS